MATGLHHCVGLYFRPNLTLCQSEAGRQKRVVSTLHHWLCPAGHYYAGAALLTAFLWC